jgi:hypothetical protein
METCENEVLSMVPVAGIVPMTCYFVAVMVVSTSTAVSSCHWGLSAHEKRAAAVSVLNMHFVVAFVFVLVYSVVCMTMMMASAAQRTHLKNLFTPPALAFGAVMVFLVAVRLLGEGIVRVALRGTDTGNNLFSHGEDNNETEMDRNKDCIEV